MTEKRGLASKSKNSFSNSKIFILAILSILMFAASVSYAVAAGPIISTSTNTIANGTGTLGTGDTFFFSDSGRTMNETIQLTFNITFPTVAEANGTSVNVSVNCSGVGDVKTPIRNATILQSVAVGSIADGYQVKYNASCFAVFNGSNIFYPALVNITIRNISGGAENFVSTVTTGIVIYNMSNLPTAPNGCMQWGPETTNFSKIPNFNNANLIMQMFGNISCFTCTDGPGVCGAGAQILPPAGCPDGICGWMRNFTAVNKLNFTSLNLTASGTYTLLSGLPTAIQITVPASNARYAAATTRVWFNSSFFSELNTNATVELYGIPFKGMPSIVTDSGAVNNTEVKIVPGTNGITWNITFAVFGFSTYNASDITAPIIGLAYPVNGTAIAINNPRLNITLNGTGSEINISTLVVNFSGTGVSDVVFTYLNFTCINQTNSGPSQGERVFCLLNQTMTNATVTNGTYNLRVNVEDMGGDAGIRQNTTLTFVASTMLPKITFERPLSLAFTNNTPYVNFTLSFNSTAAISSNGINLSSVNISVFRTPGAAPSYNLQNGTDLTTQINLSFVKLTAIANGAFDVWINFTGAEVLSNSSIMVSVTAQDNLSNVLPWTNLTFYSDAKKPFVTLNTSPWYNTSDTTPSLNFTAEDTVAINLSCGLTIDGVLNKTQVFLNGSRTYLITPDTALIDGIHSWGINCTDNAGNLNATFGLIARNFTIDTHAPTVNTTNAMTPLNNTYIGATNGVFKINISDAPLTRDNVTQTFTTSNTRATCTWSGQSNTFGVQSLNLSNYTHPYVLAYGNCSVVGLSKYVWVDNDNLTMTLYVNDTVDNELVYVHTWSIDTTAPAITSPKISKTNLTQGENITFYVTIADPSSGVNTTNATVFIEGLYGASTNTSNFTRTLILISGSNYSFQYNTTELAQGNYSLKGSVFATDFRADGTNLNTTLLGSVSSLNFTLTSPTYGTPIIERVEINSTTFVLNRTIMLNISVNVSDSDNISQVWVMFTGNTGVANSSLKVPLVGVTGAAGIGGTYRNMTYAFNVTGASTADVTMTIYANDTLGRESSVSRTLTVRQKAAEIDLLVVTPSTPYQFQSPLNITARVFALDGVTRFEVNITNASLRTVSGAAAGALTNLTAYCDVVNATASLYVCYNMTGGQSLATNTTGAHIIATSTFVSGSTTATNINTTYNVYLNASLSIGTITPSTTFTFVEIGRTFTAADNSTQPSVPNGTITLSIRDSTAGFLAALPNVNLSKTPLNLSVTVRNSSELKTMLNTTTASIVHTTNLGTLIANTTNSSVNVSSAVYALIALEPTANNASAFEAAITTSNNVTVFCSELGITNCSLMVIYQMPFNTSINNTIGTTWTSKAAYTTYDGLNNSLTAGNITFSGILIAIAEPIACTNGAQVPSTGCIFSGVIYTSGRVCSNVYSGTAAACPAAATTTTTTTTSTSSDSTPATNTTPTTSSTYLLGTITSGVERTVAVSLSGVPVTSIAITTNTQALNTELKIQQLTSAPTDAGNVPSKVYAYMSVTPKNLAPETIATAKMSFSVPKSWMTENGITEDQIVLSRYADGKWNELETAILSSDDTKVNYQALTPGFSYFAVTIRSAPLVAPEEQTEVPTKPAEKEETPVEQPPAEEQPPVKESKSWIAWLIAALVVVAGVAGYFIYRNMSEK